MYVFFGLSARALNISRTVSEAVVSPLSVSTDGNTLQDGGLVCQVFFSKGSVGLLARALNISRTVSESVPTNCNTLGGGDGLLF